MSALALLLLSCCAPGVPQPETADELRTNRLGDAASPYLRQHANNPVDWYPWSDEAFDRAKADDRLVFLSIGYSTCHWCRVMAHESFEDEEIAAFLNERFVSIKVDRDERPDIDDVYMQAVQAMNRGRGGWPMTLILTPSGEPVFAATYLPPRDGVRGARRGLMYVLKRISDDWRADPAQLRRQAAALTQHLVRLSSPAPPRDVPPAEHVRDAVRALAMGFDATNNGFGGAPKFPRPVALRLLLHAPGAVAGQTEMVRDTLIAMSRGGIHDQLVGGFHRYSVDAAWRVPHFEKMLYDNAQLVTTATEAWRATHDPRLEELVARTIAFLARDLLLSSGAFASAIDADSLDPAGELVEGAFYTWTPSEAAAALGPDQRWAIEALGIVPHGPLEGRSVAWQAQVLDEAKSAALPAALRALADARSKRPPPFRDETVVTAWNALTVQALARAGTTFGERAWIAMAERAADVLLQSARGREPRLARTIASGAQPRAMLEDEAAVALACLDLFVATHDTSWLDHAIRRMQTAEQHFRSPEGGFYRAPDDGESLLVRSRDDHEGSEPSGTAMALEAALRLAHLTGDERWRSRADEILAAMAPLVAEHPTAMPAVVAGLAHRHAGPTEVVVVSPEGSDAHELEEAARRAWLPSAEILLIRESEAVALADRIPWLAGKRAIDGRPTAFFCQGGVCRQPAHDAQDLSAQLSARGGASAE